MKKKSKNRRSRKVVRKPVLKTASQSLVAQRNLCNCSTLLKLEAAFKNIYRKTERAPKVADATWNALTSYLRVLEALHGLSHKTLAHDPKAVSAYGMRLRDLVARLPGFSGSAQFMIERTQRDKRAVTHRCPCSLVTLEGMAGIYLAAFNVFHNDPKELAGAMDAVAGLSLMQGRLESLSGSFWHGGQGELEDFMRWGDLTGDPFFQPDPGDPFPEEPFTPLLDGPFPPPGDNFGWMREHCEGMLIDALTGAAGNAPNRAPVAWADNIDSITLQGTCARNAMIIRGHDFGNQPEGAQLIMSVNGNCAEVPVDPRFWNDTRIVVILPVGVSPGTVGFYNPLDLNIWNRWVSSVNGHASTVLVASKCLGAPISLPTLEPWPAQVPCPPNFGVNYVAVGLPIINLFEAISSIETDTGPVVLESGDRIRVSPGENLALQWNVSNADTFMVELVSNVGLAFGRRDTIVDPVDDFYDFGSTSHNEPRLYEYRLTATGVCGSQEATVVISASKRPNLSIDGIEVTHSIQTPENTVTLIENKRAVVRVQMSHQLNGFNDLLKLDGVRGRMRVISEGGQPTEWQDPINGSGPPPAPTPGASIDVPATADFDRANTDDMLNFLLPAAWCRGSIRIEVEATINNFAVPAGGVGFSETPDRSFGNINFERSELEPIRFLPAELELDGETIPRPSDQQCQDFLTETLKYIPTQNPVMSRLPGSDVSFNIDSFTINTPFGEFSRSLSYDYAGNVLLRWIVISREVEALSAVFDGRPVDFDYWAVLVPLGGPGLWGEAGGIPAREYITPMANDAGAHELAHCLNQEHLGVACPNGQQAPGGDDPDTWVGGGAVIQVPFDITANSTVTGAWDLMTYCNTTWTNVRRWNQIFNYINSL